MLHEVLTKKFGGYVASGTNGKLQLIKEVRAEIVLTALKKIVLTNTVIVFPPHPRYHAFPSLATHFTFAVNLWEYPSPPPNATQTNTYFFSGGFAVKVSL